MQYTQKYVLTIYSSCTPMPSKMYLSFFRLTQMKVLIKIKMHLCEYISCKLM